MATTPTPALPQDGRLIDTLPRASLLALPVHFRNFTPAELERTFYISQDPYHGALLLALERQAISQANADAAVKALRGVSEDMGLTGPEITSLLPENKHPTQVSLF